MRRRDALKAACGLAAAVLALLAQAQPAAKPRRIGFSVGVAHIARGWFVSAMKGLGWTEGRDFVLIVVDWDAPETRSDPDGAVARLLAAKPDLIFTQGTSRALAVHRLTSTIPIVMWTSGYPVEAGVARSLAKPGMNVTGNTIYAGTAIWGKLVELLREVRPVRRIGVLWGYAPPAFLRKEIELPQQEIRAAAQSFGLSARIAEYSTPDEGPQALGRLVADNVDALIIAGRGSLGPHVDRVMQVAERNRLLTMADSLWPLADRHNPLLAYGASWEVLMAQAVNYVDRVLRGANPGDLPIQRPSKVELVVNLRTARLLGVTMPQSVLLRADRVIE